MADDFDMRKSFRESLQQFILTDVTPLGSVLGAGSYGSVEEVMHNHVICAGKRLYDTLIEDGNQGAGIMAQKYLLECQLMSSLRHPNITLFLGVCFLPDSKLPLLVMERLDTNLDDILEHMPNLPLSLKCSVLEDIARGLLYLHGRSPPIIHRDLTARNILLTASLDAKITDMGNSRIIDLKPGQLVRTLSQIPGTLVYMPPEALDDKHRYGPSLDIFSFGHLALFTIIQIFPGVLLSSTYVSPGNVEEVLGRTEIERRKEYIDSLEAEIGQAHPTLILLIKQCLHNAPHKRPETEELLTRLQGIRVGVEGLHQSSRIAKLEVMRARLENNQVARKDLAHLQLEKQEPSEATSVVYKPIPIPSNPSDTANMDWMEESYESLPPEISHQNLADHESQKEEICINLPPDILQQELAPLEEQRWYWEGMSVSEADKKLSGAPDGTFLVCDSQTEGKHILVVRKDKANEIIHISQADGMYGFFDMSVLPRKPILAVFPTIPALVEYFKHVPLMKYSECLDVTLAYPVSRIEESVDSPPAQHDLSPLKDQKWYWGGIGSEKIRDELHGTPNGTFLVRDSREKGNYTLVVRIDGVNKLLRISCQSGNNKYGFYNNSVDPPALVEFPSVPALVEYFKRVPLTEYNPSLDITLFHPLARDDTTIHKHKVSSKSSLALSTDKEDENCCEEPRYSHLPEVFSQPKPHMKLDTWFCDIDRNAATAMLTGKPTGTFLFRPTKNRSKQLQGAVHTHTMDLVYKDRLRHLRIYHKDSKFCFESGTCNFSSLMELVMYFSEYPIHHNFNTTLKYPARSSNEHSEHSLSLQTHTVAV